MRSINTGFSGDTWNFSGIGLGSFGPSPVSHVRSTQFDNASGASSEPELPLPPFEYNLSPNRPRLPAVPPPSPPNEQLQEDQAKLTSKSRRREPIVKRKAVVPLVPPERPAPGETQAPSAPAGTANVSKVSKSKQRKAAKSIAKRVSTGTPPIITKFKVTMS